MTEINQHANAAAWPAHENTPLDTTADFIFDRYVQAIVGKDHERYDMIEIHGVRNYALDLDRPTNYEIDNKTPTSFSVYVRIVGGGIECVGDFSHYGDAYTYAVELNKQFDWPISDFFSKGSTETTLATIQ